jgi:hypothetical protein
MHGGEDSVRARLEREVELLTNGRRVGHGVSHVLSEVVRMRTGESDTANPVDLSNTAEQITKDGATAPVDGEVTSVGVDVLAEECDFDDTLIRQTLDFADDVPRSP